MRQRVFQPFHLAGEETRQRVLVLELVAAGDDAGAHELRHHVARMNQHLQPEGGGLLGELARRGRGIGDAGHHGAHAIAVATGDDELDVLGRQARLAKHRAGEQVGQRAGSRNRNDLALELRHRADVRLGVERIGQPRPSAAGYLDVGAATRRDHRAAGRADITVESAGDQRLQRDRVALEGEHLDVEAVLLGEAAVLVHEDEASVALRLDRAVPPFGKRLRAGGIRRNRECCH